MSNGEKEQTARESAATYMAAEGSGLLGSLMAFFANQGAEMLSGAASEKQSIIPLPSPNAPEKAGTAVSLER